MTPKEKAVWMMDLYNGQFNDYKIQAAKPDLTEEQKVILRKKKEILTEVYPLIKLYVGYADSGVLPPADTEAVIMRLTNELLSL